MRIVEARVKPGARAASLREENGIVLIATPARPEKGKANEAARKMLAAHLGVAPSEVVLLRGSTSRMKVFRCP